MAVDARLLVVDENDDVLDGLSEWISECPGFRVVGVAHSAGEALERIERVRPDIVLMDLSLPDGNGLDAARRIKSRAGAPLVVLTVFLDSAAIRAEARAAGADGCLSKPDITREFLPTLRPLLRSRMGDTAHRGVPRAAAPVRRGVPPEVE